MGTGMVFSGDLSIIKLLYDGEHGHNGDTSEHKNKMMHVWCYLHYSSGK